MAVSFEDPGQAADQLTNWAEDLQRKAQRYQGLHGRMAGLTVTETSDDNRVTVTVDNTGVPTDIRLAEQTRGMDPSAVAAELMSCLRKAQATLRREVTSMVQDTVGDDDAGAAIINQYAERFPNPEEAQENSDKPKGPVDEDEYYRRDSWLQ